MPKTSEQYSDVAAEDSIIGNLLFNPSLLPIVATNLVVGAFTRDVSKTTFQAIQDIAIETGGRMDFLRLEDKLGGNGDAMNYLARLQAEVFPVTESVLVSHIERVNNQSKLLQLRGVLDEMDFQVNPLASYQDVLSRSVSRLQAIGDKNEFGATTHISLATVEAMRAIMQWKNGELAGGIPFGLRTVDKAVGHFPPGEMTVIAGRSSMGKTSAVLFLAYSTAVSISKGRLPPGQVLFFSAEMSARDLAIRLACLDAGVDSDKARKGTLDDSELAKVRVSLEYIATLPIVVDASPSPRIQDILFRTMMVGASTPVSLVIVDYIELCDETGENEEIRVGRIARGLKAVAKRLGVPLVALSQLNRKSEERGNRMPELSDLRQSGTVENEASIVILLYRSDYYTERGIDVPNAVENTCTFIVAKHRNGRVGKVNTYYDAKTARFGDLELYRSVLNA